MKKISFALVLPFLVFLLTCSAWATDNPKMKAHTLPHGFSIAVPADWQIHGVEESHLPTSEIEFLFGATFNWQAQNKEATLSIVKCPNPIPHLNQTSLKALSKTERQHRIEEYKHITRLTQSYEAVDIVDVNNLIGITVFKSDDNHQTGSFTIVESFLFQDYEIRIEIKYSKALDIEIFRKIFTSFKKL